MSMQPNTYNVDDEPPRVVTDERDDTRVYEIETESPLGRRTVHRHRAGSPDDAVTAMRESTRSDDEVIAIIAI